MPGAGRAGRRPPRDVAAVVAACAEAGVPFVARGSGTGLSGGALPHADGVLIVTSQMRTILEVDRGRPARGRRARRHQPAREPGRAAPHGYYYAPDPSSQQICSIGGNVAENSGGAHCLKYGFTTNHVHRRRDRHARRRGGRARRQGPGRRPATTCSARSSARRARSASPPGDRPADPGAGGGRTLLAGFDGTDEAGAATSAIIAAGVVPAAIEMMDALAIEAAEAAVHCGYPAGAGAVLIVELDGPAAEVERPVRAGRARCARRPARSRSGSPPTTPSGR